MNEELERELVTESLLKNNGFEDDREDQRSISKMP